jgi:hypothetical protein
VARRRTIELPEVIVSQDEVRTFRAFVERSRNQPLQVAETGVPDGLEIPAGEVEVATLSEPTAIVIPPIEIEPIVLFAMREGGGE